MVYLPQAVIVGASIGVFIPKAILLLLVGGTASGYFPDFFKRKTVGTALYFKAVGIALGGGSPVEFHALRRQGAGLKLG